jgi:multiple sugar transport system substrate-binding protein
MEVGKMKVKRLLSVLLVAMMALILFSACTTTNVGGAAPTQAPNAGTEKPDETTSVKTDVIHVWSNDAHNRDEYTEVINKFNENTGKEKGIKIEYKVYGGDYYNSLDIAISANEEPHLFKSMKTGQYAETGRVVAISDLPGGDKLIEETSKYFYVPRTLF